MKIDKTFSVAVFTLGMGLREAPTEGVESEKWNGFFAGKDY